MKKLFILIALAFTLLGCATPTAIDTINKKIAVFEISYQEALTAAISLHSQGLLNQSSQEAITRAIETLGLARQSVYTAIERGNISLAEDNLVRAQQALMLLTQLIRQKESDNGKHLSCNGNCIGNDEYGYQDSAVIKIGAS